MNLLPQAVHVLPLTNNPPIVNDPILIDVKTVTVHDNNEGPSQFEMALTSLSPNSWSTFITTNLATASSSVMSG